MQPDQSTIEGKMTNHTGVLKSISMTLQIYLKERDFAMAASNSLVALRN